MRVTFLVGLALGFGAAVAAPPAVENAAGSEWMTDFAVAQARARRENKPLMVVFR